MEIVKYLIHYASWPIAILVIAIMFKDRIGKVAGLKFNNYEVLFNNELQSIKSDTQAKPCVVDLTLHSTHFLKSNMLELADRSPIAVILQAWSIMEYTITECAERELNIKFNNASAAIQLLYDNSKILDIQLAHYFRLLAVVEKCKNAENVVTKNSSLEIADLVLSVADGIKTKVDLGSKQQCAAISN